MKFGLDEHTIDEIQSVFRKYPGIDRVLIYGSRAMNTYRPGSDIDLTIAGPDLTHADILKLSADLVDLEMLYSFDV